MDVWTPGPISIHAPREGCDLCLCRRLTSTITISIHAPREGCDGRCWTMAWSSTVIPIHAPREGCDPGGRACTGLLTDFNPRTPRGVRRPGAGRLHHQMPISIHAPREGCDGIGVPAGHDPLLHFNPRTPRGVRLGPQMILTRPPVFQSTHPARGATSKVDLVFQQAKISIHAPREGCDLG